MHQQRARLDRFIRFRRPLQFRRHAARQIARGLGAVATLLAEAALPVFEVDAGTTEALFGEHDREPTRGFSLALFGCGNRHCGETRR
ncbi:hypothetical protein D9M72_445460 [compost metagenome]